MLTAPSGCRAGDTCPFLHQTVETPSEQNVHDNQKTSEPAIPKAAATEKASSKGTQEQPVTTPTTQQRRPQPPRQVDRSKVVQRPTIPAATQNPRVFQMTQIRTRFKAAEGTAVNGSTTTLPFAMEPSDPDFPFEIQGGVQCILQIPTDFPKSKPALKVTNKDMERGFQINVERGFDTIWAETTNPTLLRVMNLLDRQLEAILTGKKAQTIKLVVNRGPPVPSASSTPAALSNSAQTVTLPARPQAPTISAQRREQARTKRQAEVQVLKHRLGRDPLFTEAAGATIFSVPVDPRKRDALPTSLKSVKSVRLYVPELYDLDSCSIELLGVEGQEAVNVEEAFARRAKSMTDMSLMAHLNYLTQNMHNMASEQASSQALVKPQMEEVMKGAADTAVTQSQSDVSTTMEQEASDSHIKITPRPPEWTARAAVGGEDYESSYSSSYSTFDDESDEEDTTETHTADQTSSTVRERGIMLSLPHLELYNIELLELVTLSLTIKCERCKDTMDISNIKPNESNDHTGMRTASCKKCAYPFAIGWRKDLMHANSIRAGYLDFEGCTVVDLLPSHFVPTCSECSTAFPAPGVIAVRGDSALAMCRECHKKMTFKLPEVRFLAVSASARANEARSLPSRKPKESLGIVAGTELPLRGRCRHYRKSYRWFRFSCCSKVFPCDRCHDEATDHINEFANRMICGWCSVEQNYSPEECRMCKGSVVGKKGTGFWEGGKGTREQSRMSRKDPRKYKRIGTSAKVKAQAKTK